jgi:hypothetical protein
MAANMRVAIRYGGSKRDRSSRSPAIVRTPALSPAAGHALDAVGHGVKLPQQAPPFVQQLDAGGDQLRLARAAVEQQHIQSFLQLAHAAGRC